MHHDVCLMLFAFRIHSARTPGKRHELRDGLLQQLLTYLQCLSCGQQVKLRFVDARHCREHHTVCTLALHVDEVAGRHGGVDTWPYGFDLKLRPCFGGLFVREL